MFEWIYKCVEFEINIEFGVIMNGKKQKKKIGVIHLWDAIIRCVILEIKLLKNSFDGI